MKPNQKLIDMWTRAAHEYHDKLAGSAAEEYLDQRGLLDGAARFLLGFVAEPAPGHEDRFKNHLSIPYITGAGVIGFKFRRLDSGDPKYTSPTGQKHHLYNVQAIIDAIDEVLVCEGELDAIAATLAGHPAVAVAGVNAWKPYFKRCFDGIGKIIVVTDNDNKVDGSNPGQDLARRLVDELPNAVRVSLPVGEDINSTLLSHGESFFKELIGSID